MPVDTTPANLVSQLRRVGLRPPERLVEHIMELGSAAREPLMELGTNTDILMNDKPLCWGPIHGLRLLGELRDPSLIQPLLHEFPLQTGDNQEQQQLIVIWGNDALQLIGRMGSSATETLWASFDDEELASASRGAASDALCYITAADPSLRAGIVEGLRQRFASTQSKLIATFIIGALCRLAVAEAYGDVLDAYRAGRVDTKMLPARVARQGLLGKPNSDLECVNHTFWSRYDEHGPFPPQES